VGLYYHARLQNVIEQTKKAPRRPRVFCLEWIDPPYCCGHWVPEMVAGGEDALGRKDADSVRISWADIAAFSPEILIVSPCGLLQQLLRLPGSFFHADRRASSSTPCAGRAGRNKRWRSQRRRGHSGRRANRFMIISYSSFQVAETSLKAGPAAPNRGTILCVYIEVDFRSR